MNVFLTEVSAFAQTETGRMTGTVTDLSEAVVPGVTVTITQVETKREVVTTTDSNGRYVSIPLPIGFYRVAAERAGFKKVIRSGITLKVGETAVVDLKLEVGWNKEPWQDYRSWTASKPSVWPKDHFLISIFFILGSTPVCFRSDNHKQPI
jgi:hypothetical protein